MLSQNPRQHITRPTGRVQHITEVPAPAPQQEVPVHLHQAPTGAVRRQTAAEAAAEVTVQEAVAEAVAHTLQVALAAALQAEVHTLAEVRVVADRVLQEVVVHLHLVAGNF